MSSYDSLDIPPGLETAFFKILQKNGTSSLNVLAQKKLPSNPAKYGQLLRASLFVRWESIWGALSNICKLKWHSAWGGWPGSGYSLFVSVNARRVRNGLDMLLCLIVRALYFTQFSGGSIGNFRAVAWSHSLQLFVAGSNQPYGCQFCTSPDGVNWTQTQFVSDLTVLTLIWSNRQKAFFAGGYGSMASAIFHSGDGVTWNADTVDSDFECTNICDSAENHFTLACGVDAFSVPIIKKEFSTTKWSTLTTSPGAIVKLVWASKLNKFLGLARVSNGHAFFLSVDGQHWSQQTDPGLEIVEDVCWSDELELFVAVLSSNSSYFAYTSSDGVTWTAQARTFFGNWDRVIWCSFALQFVATASSGAYLFCMTSPDGVNWTSVSSLTDGQFRGLASADRIETLLAVGSGSVLIGTP